MSRLKSVGYMAITWVSEFGRPQVDTLHCISFSGMAFWSERFEYINDAIRTLRYRLAVN